MTLVNVVASPERILIAVDTDCVDPTTGSHFERSKLSALPHVNAVLAGRGRLTLTNYAICSLLELPGDFDAMAEALPRILTELHQALLASENVVAYSGGQDIFFAGWSPRHKRLQALHYVLRDGAFALLDEIRTARVAPGDCFTELPASFATSRPELVAVAREQVKWMRSQSTNVGAGGRLIVAELTRDRTSIAAVASL